MSPKAKTIPKGRPTPPRPLNEPPAPARDTLPLSTQATPASGWRSTRRDGVPVRLPSGNVARLRRTFSMINLMESGDIPNPLAGHIREAIDQARAGDTTGSLSIAKLQDQEDDENKVALVQFLDMMMKSMSDIFVEPVVYQVPPGEDAQSWQPDDPDGISVADLDASDQMHAFSFAQGGAGSMSPFREEPGAAV
jgi:hypothetical protein